MFLNKYEKLSSCIFIEALVYIFIDFPVGEKLALFIFLLPFCHMHVLF